MKTPDYMMASDPELARLLELAKSHKMSPEELFEQRVSWVYGMLSENSTTTKEDVRNHLVAAGYADLSVERVARAVRDEIVADIRDRRGLRQVWDDIDEEVREEIEATHAAIVRRVMEGGQ